MRFEGEALSEQEPAFFAGRVGPHGAHGGVAGQVGGYEAEAVASIGGGVFDEGAEVRQANFACVSDGSCHQRSEVEPVGAAGEEGGSV